MYQKSRFLFFLLLISILLFSVELAYLFMKKDKSMQKSRYFVALTQLPDLALYSETYSARHRTLSTPFDIFKDDGTLYEYERASFIMNGKIGE